MAPNLPHSIFDPLSCPGTQWIIDKVMIEHVHHSVLIFDIPTAIFPLDCSRASVCPCTQFRVRCRLEAFFGFLGKTKMKAYIQLTAVMC